MDEFPVLGAAVAALILFFSVFMIANVGKNVNDEIC